MEKGNARFWAAHEFGEPWFAFSWRRPYCRLHRCPSPTCISEKGNVAFVDARDIGDAVANCLLQPELHFDRPYKLTGPNAVDFEQVAECLSRILDREISFEAASVSGYLAYLRSTDHSWKQILSQTVLHIGLRFGQAEDVSPELCHPIKDERRTVALSFSNPLINHGSASLRLI